MELVCQDVTYKWHSEDVNGTPVMYGYLKRILMPWWSIFSQPDVCQLKNAYTAA